MISWCLGYMGLSRVFDGCVLHDSLQMDRMHRKQTARLQDYAPYQLLSTEEEQRIPTWKLR